MPGRSPAGRGGRCWDTCGGWGGFCLLRGWRPVAGSRCPAGWTQAGLPRALDGDQVAALLASCDPRTRTGRRDLAILTLLARLGLRAGEVAALRLDDIDWRRGEITVRGKGNRQDRLPLPADAGQRIVDYLHDGRPEAAQ